MVLIKNKKNKIEIVVLVLSVVLSIILGTAVAYLIYLSLKKKKPLPSGSTTAVIIPPPVLSLTNYPTKKGLESIISVLNPVIGTQYGKYIFISIDGTVLNIVSKTNISYIIDTYSKQESFSDWNLITTYEHNYELVFLSAFQEPGEFSFSDNGRNFLFLYRTTNDAYCYIFSLVNNTWLEYENILNVKTINPIATLGRTSSFMSGNGLTIYTTFSYFRSGVTTITIYKKIAGVWNISNFENQNFEVLSMSANSSESKIFFVALNLTSIIITYLTAAGHIYNITYINNVQSFDISKDQRLYTTDYLGSILAVTTNNLTTNSAINCIAFYQDDGSNNWTISSFIQTSELTNNIGVPRMSITGSFLSIAIPNYIFPGSFYSGKILIYTKNTSGILSYSKKSELLIADSLLPGFTSYKRAVISAISGDGTTVIENDPTSSYTIGINTYKGYLVTYR